MKKSLSVKLLKYFLSPIISSSLLATPLLAADKNPYPPLTESSLSQLQLKMFPGSSKTPSCKVLSRGPKARLEEIDPALNDFTERLLKTLKDKDEDELGRYFHPRVRKQKDRISIGTKLFATLRGRYEEPWDFSIFRVFALSLPEADKPVIPCTEDSVNITALYGYPLEFGVWIQMMSPNELSRIFMIVVPHVKEGKWYVGGLHIQQWSFQGKDYESWAKEGIAAIEAKDDITAFARFDVAQKMLFGGDFLEFPIKNEILGSRNQSILKEDVLKKAVAITGNPNIVYIGTALNPSGLAFLVREKIVKDLSTNEMREACKRSGKAMLDAGWLKHEINGINCDFIYPNNNPKQQGEIGGFYYSKRELEKVAGKK
jgi:hypothetical protein